MLGFIPFVLAIIMCIVYGCLVSRDTVYSEERTLVDIGFDVVTPLVCVCGIVCIWAAYNSGHRWAISIIPSIFWTIVLFFETIVVIYATHEILNNLNK